MKIKSTYAFALLAATSTLFVSSSSLFAADTDDASIEAAAAKSHVFKTYLKNDSIKTEAKDGVVTLTGTVTESSHKSLAENTVENLPGVTSVNNQLVVSGEEPREHSDTWIKTKVKTALLFHRNVRGSTTVNVKDGVVTLQGEAASQAQKDLTTEYAQDIDNVKEVKNNMTIAEKPSTAGETMGEKIDDASITAQVRSALLSHRSTSALHTKVSTTDGLVTVSGTAKNDAEKTLVTKLTTDINGVVGVVNNMTVAMPAQ